MPGAFQAELQRFLDRLRIAEDDSRTMRRKLIALRVNTRDAWGAAGGGSGCLTTITGKVVGCDVAQAPLPLSQLRVVGHTTGTAYGTFTVTSGTFALDLILDTADTSLDLYATGPGVRFTESGAQTKSVTQCSSNAVGAITTTPASGYHCHVEFPFPIADALNLVDPVFGNRVVNWAVNSGSHIISPGSPLWWTTRVNTTTIGGTPCSSVVTPLGYALRSNQTTLGPDWLYNAGAHAPPPVCPNTAGPAATAVSIPTGTRTGTAPGVSTKMDFTWAYTAVSPPGAWLYGNASGTIRIYEP